MRKRQIVDDRKGGGSREPGGQPPKFPDESGGPPWYKDVFLWAIIIILLAGLGWAIQSCAG
jgi:hypothetical protein